MEILQQLLFINHYSTAVSSTAVQPTADWFCVASLLRENVWYPCEGRFLPWAHASW